MSILLYTPATGFPDLEAKIAYGLARVGIESFGSQKVLLRQNNGFYTIEIDGRIDKLEKTFNLLCRRLLSSTYISQSTPGITGRTAESIKVDENESFSLFLYQKIPEFHSTNENKELICRHKEKKIKKVSNVIGFSTSTSYHHVRDGINITKYEGIPRRPTNPKEVCKTCAMLSLLGIWYATFVFSIKDKEVFIIPMPTKTVDGTHLENIFSLQHQIRKDWINQDIPQILIPIIFLSKIPSSADILKDFNLHIAVISRQQGYHVDGLFLVNIDNYIAYLSDNSFNIAIIDRIINSNFIQKKNDFNALSLLDLILHYKKIHDLPKFARLYVQETSTNDFINLLYPETSKYLLREVAMIKPEIIENNSLGSLARTLRYFIRERKYGYADDIRNARKDSRDFEETIAKMLREGRLRSEQKKMIHLPTEEEMKEIFRLANENFEEVKTALVILAFSFPSSKEEVEEIQLEIKEEVQND